MIVAHTADLHLDERAPHETLDEQVERLQWIGVDAHSSGASLMLCAGDVFERASTPAERNAAIVIFLRWSRMFPVVLVYGNHDRPGDLDYLGALSTEHQIAVISRPVIVTPPDLHIQVACMPWPRKSWLAGKVKAGTDIGQLANEAVRVILNGFCSKLGATEARFGKTVLLGHIELGAALTDSGQPMAGLSEAVLSESDLRAVGADYYALGHIHKQQVLGGDICYPGSPRQTTFGEEGGKGYALVELDTDDAPVIDHRVAPGRTLHTADLHWEDGQLLGDTVELEKGQTLVGQAVRLRFKVDASDRGQAQAEAELLRQRMLDQGAASVKLDPRVKATHRVRSETIREASSNADRLRSLWEARGDEPERSESILAKLGELEVASEST